jgi:uncharacterized protein (DUF362 family)
MPKSKVVLVKSGSLAGAGEGQRELLKSMLSEGARALFDADSPVDIWQYLSKTTGRIGLKSNCIAGKNMSTSAPLTYALCELFTSAGKPDRDLVIWERSNRELKRAGFELNAGRDGVRCMGTDSRGIGYGSDFHKTGKIGSLVSKIVESECDHLINMPILKDHWLAGVAGSMKNYYGAIHNPNKYHDNNCDPFVAELNSLPVIADKNILIIMDATRAQYHGGPGYSATWANKPQSILLSSDPVAVDAVSEMLIEKYRAAAGLGSLEASKRSPKWLKTAEMLGLGNSSLSNIDIVNLEVS